MRARLTASALVSVAFILSAQTPSIPYAVSFGPLLPSARFLTFRKVEYTYPQRFRSIRQVDFRNLTIPDFQEPGRPDSDLQLKNGSRKWIEDSSSTEGLAKVFRLDAGRLTIVPGLDWDEHFDAKSKYSFDARTNTLVVRAAHYLPGDAHCCVSAMDVFTLRWAGTTFAQASMKTELSDHGKRAGKTLPN